MGIILGSTRLKNGDHFGVDEVKNCVIYLFEFSWHVF